MTRTRTDAEGTICPFLEYRDTPEGKRPRQCLTTRCMMWIERAEETGRGDCGLIARDSNELPKTV